MFIVESGSRTSSCATSSSRVLPHSGSAEVIQRYGGRVRRLDRPGVERPESACGRLRLVQDDVAAGEQLGRVEEFRGRRCVHAVLLSGSLRGLRSFSRLGFFGAMGA